MKKGFSHESTALSVPVEWYTPPHIFESLKLQFDLDPCAAPQYDCVPALHKYVLPINGLEEQWFGTVWMNPPYGKETKTWIEKLVKHGDGIALVFSRTDTKWFQQAAKSADVVCFLESRVKFINGKTGQTDGTPGAGSCLIGWGRKSFDAITASGLGICMTVS